MPGFNTFLSLLFTLAIMSWALSLYQFHSNSNLINRTALFFIPLIIAIAANDWLIQQSLSQWLSLLADYKSLIAIWFSLEALILLSWRPKSAWALLVLPGPWFALLFWQLQCLQSGQLPWPFWAQTLMVSGLMSLLILIGQQLKSKSAALLVILAQLFFCGLWACSWPKGSTAGLDIKQFILAIVLIAALIIIGVFVESYHQSRTQKR